jgi:flagellar biosynthesis component FlhA
LTGFRRRKNNNLLALAFVLGVVCCLILPLWTWLLAVGLLLIAAGCRILVD